MRPQHLPVSALTAARHRSREINSMWRRGPVERLASWFDGASDAESLAERAVALLSDPGWIAGVLRPLIDGLRADPWFEPGWRISHDALRTSAGLLDDARVAVTATVTRAATLNAAPPPSTVVIPGRVTVTRYVRAGNARMRRWRAEAVTADFSAVTAWPCTKRAPLDLRDGMVVRNDGRTDAGLIVSAARDLVAVTVTIKPGAAPLAREYAVADGRFLRVACADDAASRMEMLMTFLRVSGHDDAGAAFDAASHHPAFHLRWAALREWLMHDAAAARPRLAQLAASDRNAEVRVAARATLAVLDRRMASSPCHA